MWLDALFNLEGTVRAVPGDNALLTGQKPQAGHTTGRRKQTVSSYVPKEEDTLRGVSSAGRAPALQAGGHRFDPGTLHHKEGIWANSSAG